MTENRRKHPRREVNLLCWLGAANEPPVIRARVRNISEGGAKVIYPPNTEVPDTIDLYMTADGKVGRRCKVVWRSEDSMGVMFVSRAKAVSTGTTVAI